MKKITFFVLLLFSFANQGYSQAAAYVFANSTSTYTPTSASATVLATVKADDVVSAAQDIGFTFVYEGLNYTQFRMSSNGFISLGALNTSNLSFNDFAAANASSKPIIAPLWDDLDGATPASAVASYEVSGTAPNRVLTVEWRNWEWNYQSTTPVISFQVKLYETTGVIQYVYRQDATAVNLGSASIGISSAVGSGAGSFLNLTNLTTPAVSSLIATADIATKPTTGQMFTFSPPLCPQITALVVPTIGSLTATANWTSAGSETQWQYYILPSAAAAPTAASNTGVLVNTKPIAISGLTPSTSYRVYVRAVCSVTESSAWVASNTFTTLAACAVPTALVINGIGPTIATANWTTGENETQWEYYLLPSAAAAPVAASNTGIVVTSKPVNLTGLTVSTGYRFYVRAVCSPTLQSTWLASTTFTTLPSCPVPTAMSITGITTASVTANWTPGFAETEWEYYVLPSTAAAPAATSNTGVVTTSRPVVVSGLSQLSSYKVYVRAKCSLTETSTWLASSTFTTLATCPVPSAASITGITPAGAIATWTNNGSETEWEYYVLPSTAIAPTAASNTGATTTVKPLIIGGLAQLTGYRLYVRAKCSPTESSTTWLSSAIFTTLATCPVPTAMTVASITTSGATANWTSNGTETQWEYYILPSAAAAPTSTSATGQITNIKPLVLTGLSQLTSYKLYVRAKCSANDSSTTWLASSIFITLPTCPAPTLAVISEVGPTVATANWTNGSTETQWEYYVLPSTAAAPTAASNTGILTLTKPVSLAGLASATAYRFYVRAYCSPTDSSTWLTSSIFTTLAACPAPTAAVISALAPTSASATWTNGFSETRWEYYVLPSTATAPVATSNTGTVVTLKPVSLVNLLPNTTYKLYVRAACSASSTSGWLASSNFTTPCLPVTLPYFENFESAVVPAMPVCTLSANEGTGNNWITAAAPGSGFTTKALRYSYNSTNPANAWFYTTGITLTAGQSIDVRFKYGSNSTIYIERLKVAFGTSLTGSAMTNLVVDLPNITGSTQQAAFVTVTAPATGVYYFGFNAYSITNQNGLFVDDISIQTTPTCPPPTALSANTITNNSVNISFTEPAVAPALGYDYFISTVATAPIASTTPTGTVVLGLNSVDLTGLAPATTYYVWVRGKCSTSDIGPWSDSVSFLTNCNSVSVFNQNFDSGLTFPACWKKLGTAGTANIIALAASASTPNTMSMLSSNATTRAVVAMPPVNNIASGTHRLRFQARAASTVGGIIEVGYLTDYFDASSFVSVSSSTTTSTTVYDSFNVELGTTPLPGTFLAFRHSGTPANTVYIDNVFWEPIPTCPEPSGLIASSVTATTVNISFVESIPAAAAGYQYIVAATNTLPSASATPTGSVAAGVSTFVATGLSPATNYFVYVRSNCGAGFTSPWSNNVSFTTLCAPATSFTQNFDTTATSTFPVCWKKVGTPGTANLQATGAFSASNCLYIFGSSNTTRAVVSMPPVSNAGANTHWLKFKARSNFTIGGVIEVGYLTNPTDDASFVSVQSFTTTSATVYNDFTATLGTTPGANQILAFRHTGTPGNSVLIDDVSWEPQPSCIFPASIVASNFTTTSATVSWTAPAVAPASGYEYFISTSAASPANNSTPTGVVAAGITSVNVTGLQNSTTYYISVRSSCGSAEVSSWSGSTIFATLCDIATIPYSQDFESAIVPNIPNCSSIINEGLGNNWNVALNPTTAFGTKVLRYLYNSTNAANAWYFTQGINLVGGTSYDISYKYGNDSTFYTEKLKVSYGTANTAAGMTTVIADYPTINSATSANATVTFTPTATGVYYFGFNAYSIANQNNLLVDNISIITTPTCLLPTAVSVTTLTATSANIAWIAPATAPSNGYQYILSTTNTIPSVSATPTGVVTAGTTNVLISSLTASTSYFFYVRSACANGNFGVWTSVLSFTTPCASYTAPYLQDFVTTPAPCFTYSVGGTVASGPTGTGFGAWTASNFLNLATVNNSAKVNIYASNRAGWLISPTFNLSTGAFTFSFNYGVADYNLTDASAMGSDDSLKVLMSTNGGTTWSEITEFTAANNISNTLNTYSYNIPAGAGANVKFAFLGSSGPISDTEDYDFFVDNMKVEISLSNTSFNESSFSYYPNPVKDVLTLSYGSDISKVSVFNLLGQEVIVKTINANLGQIDMSGLANGTYMVRVVTADAVKTVKVIKQ